MVPKSTPNTATMATPNSKTKTRKLSKALRKLKQKGRLTTPSSLDQEQEGGDGVDEAPLTSNLDDWEWSEVACPDNAMITDEIGGFLCLEELDGVDCVWQGDDQIGRIVQFRKSGSSTSKKSKRARPDTPLSLEETSNYISIDDFEEGAQYVRQATDADEENTPAEVNTTPVVKADSTNLPTSKKATKQAKKAKGESAEPSPAGAPLVPGTPDKSDESDSPPEADIEAWKSLGLHKSLLNNLASLKFSTPTPIQAQTLPLTLAGRDVVGAAETGSGKTLAFGLPMLDYYLQQSTAADDRLIGLVLTPTRELAIQVRQHLSQIATDTRARVVTVVGGMSVQKQRRVLAQNPAIIVATPGRLWDILSEDRKLGNRLQTVRFLAIDEADRLLERGHFAEVANILKLINQTPSTGSEFESESSEAVEMAPGSTTPPAAEDSLRQTLIFSATLTEDLQAARGGPKKLKGVAKNKVPRSANSVLKDLMDRVQFQDPSPVLVDVTQAHGMAGRLVESRIDCLLEDKDIHLYYLLTRYPARTLVFVNSIDAIRRLVPILQLLKIPAFGLHSQMEQRARLKNVDRFKSHEQAVLVASDVAARGLDIPLVEHVIHYQIPRAADIYVHRSGRTARAQKDGISIMLCCPEEAKLFRKLCHQLSKDELPRFPVDHHILKEMKKRVKLARSINGSEHQVQKKRFDADWMRKSAAEMDVELDEGILSDDESTEAKLALSQTRTKVTNWKRELTLLLNQPIMPRGTSSGFLTSATIHDLATRLLDTESHITQLPATKKTRAISDALGL
ncbi:P-loop containing nucleoside triphosphate hydrolase protein [Dimargaris cristalligena]|uniref:P-loop containing nucleoside triphosphate hydrolase protein n=1 Tax=Dimargaris cristalligena TaxID=215637 RepID=A0A4P9ZSJ7_9FUNG|nr:P-loop containing nucleoside triphosphate hydrolase protein [Dimargaris cristalligena]|eukprot:RKP36546.1 P-loop containing nucleoside triphosphate hydrolase protein [Dimargaris cristalligena]